MIQLEIKVVCNMRSNKSCTNLWGNIFMNEKLITVCININIMMPLQNNCLEQGLQNETLNSCNLTLFYPSVYSWVISQ